MRLPMICLAILLFIAACATTQLKSEWRDQSYRGHLRKVLVIGIAKKESLKRLFEDEFVHQLQQAGVDAVAGYSVQPGKKHPDLEEIAAGMKKVGADGVLITRLVDRKVVKTYVPGRMDYPMGFWYDRYPAYYGTWPSYYGYGSRFIYTPGYMAEEEYAVMETCVYKAGDGDNLVWSASSETEIVGSDEKMVKSYIKVMVKKLQEQGLIQKKGADQEQR